MLKKVIPKLKILDFVRFFNTLTSHTRDSYHFLVYTQPDKPEPSLLFLATSDSCPMVPSSGKDIPKKQYVTN